MEKIRRSRKNKEKTPFKKKIHSLKVSFLLYLPIPILLAVLGAAFIGNTTNVLQGRYMNKFYTVYDNSYYDDIIEKYPTKITYDEYGNILYLEYKSLDGTDMLVSNESQPDNGWIRLGYFIISNAQGILIPLWVILCLMLAGMAFYKREIENGLNILVTSSEKIANQDLDFKVECKLNNEIGQVCESFETMRESLLATSRENVRMAQESRRLNSAFSHDIRTPITVMKGYIDMLEKYLPEGKIDRAKELEMLSLMHNQADRLEHYAYSMSSIQKLEDITPNRAKENFSDFMEELENSCKLIDSRVEFDNENEVDSIFVDKELVFEVVENLVSNASRYAKEIIRVQIHCQEDYLIIEVKDDGQGFSEKILNSVGNPFIHEDKVEDKDHFGLGLYICSILCRKCGGSLTVKNDSGALVKAIFENSFHS